MRINLHWGISNLVSFTIIVTMLEIKQFAMAVEKPFPCWTCCRGKNRASPPPCDFQCRTSFRTHVTAGDMLQPGGKPTSAQLKAAAAAITTWAEEDGMVTLFNDIDTGVRAVGENMFVNQPMNESGIYTALAAYENQITAADIN